MSSYSFGTEHDFYCSQKVFDLEVEKIFKKDWLLICHESELQEVGSYIALNILDTPILVLKASENNFQAFLNICSHRGCKIVKEQQGNIKSAMTCPYHHWKFDLYGRLISSPGIKGMSDEQKNNFALSSVNLENRFGFIFISLNSEPKSITELLSPAHSLLECSANLQPCLSDCKGYLWEQIIPANWKLVIENNIDGYHVPFVHSGLNDLYSDNYPINVKDNVTLTSLKLEQKKIKSLSERLYINLLKRYHLEPIWHYVNVMPSFGFEIYPEQILYVSFLPISKNKTLYRGGYIPYRNIDLPRAVEYLNYRIGERSYWEDLEVLLLMQEGVEYKGLNKVQLISPKEKAIEAFRGYIFKSID